MLIFFVARYLYIKIQPYVNLSYLLCLSDRYSYDFYIVHYFLIVGYLRIIDLTPSAYINTFIIFLLTCIFAKMLNSISNTVSTVLKQKLNLLGGKVD